MGYTKRQFIEQAMDEIGLSPFTFELSTEQMNSALRRLDTMMAEWNAMGIRLGYALPSSPTASNLDDQSGVPDSAFEAIITNLAVRIASSYGKQLMPQTMSTAKGAYNVLLSRAAAPLEQAFPGTLPYGAGNKPWRSTGDQYFPEPTEPVTVGPDGPLVLE